MSDSIRLTPWALTKAQKARECPLRFAHQYKLRTIPEIIVAGQGRVGKAVHRTIELVLQGTDMVSAMKLACVENELTRNEMIEVRSFDRSIQSIDERLHQFCTKNNVQWRDLGIEHKLGMTKDNKPASYSDPACYFRGVFDLLIPVRSNGTLSWVIMDHKTGAPPENQSWTEYEDQLKSYAVLSVVQDPAIKYVQTVLHWPRADAEKDRLVWSARWTREQIMDEYLPWLHSYIKEAEFRASGLPMATMGTHCQWCEYKYACPEFGRK